MNGPPCVLFRLHDVHLDHSRCRKIAENVKSPCFKAGVGPSSGTPVGWAVWLPDKVRSGYAGEHEDLHSNPRRSAAGVCMGLGAGASGGRTASGARRRGSRQPRETVPGRRRNAGLVRRSGPWRGSGLFPYPERGRTGARGAVPFRSRPLVVRRGPRRTARPAGADFGAPARVAALRARKAWQTSSRSGRRTR